MSRTDEKKENKIYFFSSALRFRLARVISRSPISSVTIRRLAMQMTTIHSGLCPIMEIIFELPFIPDGIRGVAEGSFK